VAVAADAAWVDPVTNAAEAVWVAPATDVLREATDPVADVMEAPAKVDGAAPVTPVACDSEAVADCADADGTLLVLVAVATVATPDGAMEDSWVPATAVPEPLGAVTPENRFIAL